MLRLVDTTDHLRATELSKRRVEQVFSVIPSRSLNVNYDNLELRDLYSQVIDVQLIKSERMDKDEKCNQAERTKELSPAGYPLDDYYDMLNETGVLTERYKPVAQTVVENESGSDDDFVYDYYVVDNGRVEDYEADEDNSSEEEIDYPDEPDEDDENAEALFDDDGNSQTECESDIEEDASGLRYAKKVLDHGMLDCKLLMNTELETDDPYYVQASERARMQYMESMLDRMHQP